MERSVKIVLVGDGAVGKTSLIATFKTGVFPVDYMPGIEGSYSIKYRGNDVLLDIWDTAGQEEYDRLRPLSYPNTNVFLICISLDRLESLQNVVTKWLPEIKQHCPDVPFILVGNKLDLRTETKIRYSDEIVPIAVSSEEGLDLAKRIGAYAYVENSAKAHIDIKYVFEVAVQAACDPFADIKGRPIMPLRPIGPNVVAKGIDINMALGSFFEKKEFSDVTFVLPDETEVHAHKMILLASMKCFHRALFRLENTLPPCFKPRAKFGDSNTIEQLNEKFIIDVDLDPQLFRLLLKALYTGIAVPYLGGVSSEQLKELQEFFSEYPQYDWSERHNKLIELALSTNTAFADACFVLDGNQRVPAHKVLLAAVSEHFATMFAKNSCKKEGDIDLIQVSGVDKLDVTTLKEYLYAGYGRPDAIHVHHNLAKMIRLAHMYNLPELMSHCEVYCKNQIDSRADDLEIWPLYQLATANNCQQLKAYLEYLMKVQYDDIKDQHWFKKELDALTHENITKEQWPGQTYHLLLKEFEKEHKKQKKKECVLM